MTKTTPMPSSGSEEVDAYLATVASPQRESLERLRDSLRSILPHADEGLKYGMPAFTLHGKAVAGYAAFKNHCSYFPMSGGVLEAAGDAAAKYPTSKGGLQFGVDERLPIGLLRRLVKLRLAEISAVRDGQRYEYFADGRVKAAGRMRNGELHGEWRWFRSDGTLMRTGRLANGDQVGTWTTWNPDGTVAKTTDF